MPDGNGVKPLGALKEYFPERNIPFFILSAEGDVLSKVAGSIVDGQYKRSAADGAYSVQIQNDSADTCEAKESDAKILVLK